MRSARVVSKVSRTILGRAEAEPAGAAAVMAAIVAAIKIAQINTVRWGRIRASLHREPIDQIFGLDSCHARGICSAQFAVCNRFHFGLSGLENGDF